MDKQKRADELSKELKKHDEFYYGQQAPVISDTDYDRMAVELRGLVESGAARADIYTKPGHSSESKGLRTVAHLRPMISLRTEVDTSEKPISEFVDRCHKAGYRGDYIAEPKYDGLALSLRWTNGILIEAVLRGDGESGEDVFANAKSIGNIPLTLAQKYLCFDEIRGEVVLPKVKFELANDLRVAEGKAPYVNCRNAVSGILRSRSSSKELLRSLVFLPYAGFGSIPWGKQSDVLAELDSIFTLPKTTNRTVDKDGMGVYYREVQKLRAGYDFDIDGVVYKVDDLEWQEKLGVIDREPRWAIAHKFLPEEVASKLIAIGVEVGQSGRLTPVARIEPVFVGGVTVQNVTLSNVFQIRKKDVRVGDTVIVRRAGDVIPEITGVDPNTPRSHYRKNFLMPKQCPVCNSPVSRPKGQMNYGCTNIDCEAQLSGKLTRAARRDILDIEGLGPSVAELLVLAGITKVSQMLDMTATDLERAGVGKANSVKLEKEITEVRSKPRTLDVAIRALSIPVIGEGASGKIVKVLSTPSAFLQAKEDAINAISPLNKTEKINLIAYMRDNGSEAEAVFSRLNIKEAEVQSGSLNDMTVVFTGSDPVRSKDELKAIAKRHGAVIGGSVSSSTTLVVFGNNAGEKLTKAGKLNIQTMSSQTFYELYR